MVTCLKWKNRTRFVTDKKKNTSWCPIYCIITASLAILKPIYSLFSGIKSWTRRLHLTSDHNYTKVKSTLTSPRAGPVPTRTRAKRGDGSNQSWTGWRGIQSKAPRARHPERALLAQPYLEPQPRMIKCWLCPGSIKGFFMILQGSSHQSGTNQNPNQLGDQRTLQIFWSLLSLSLVGIQCNHSLCALIFVYKMGITIVPTSLRCCEDQMS